MNTRCHVCRVGQRCPASVTLSWCRHSGANAAFCTLFNESDGIHIPCAAYFAPFPSALTCAIRSWVVFIYLPKRKLPLLGCFGVWREVFCRRIFRWAKKKTPCPNATAGVAVPACRFYQSVCISTKPSTTLSFHWSTGIVRIIKIWNDTLDLLKAAGGTPTPSRRICALTTWHLLPKIQRKSISLIRYRTTPWAMSR